MKCELILVSAGRETVYPLDEGTVVIGRDAGSDVQVVSQLVSRRHAKLTVSAEDGVIEDLGSSNGTLVNGKTVSRQKLRDGDEIKIGDCVLTFRVCGEKGGAKDGFVARQYSDKSLYTTAKMKKAPGFLNTLLRK